MVWTWFLPARILGDHRTWDAGDLATLVLQSTPEQTVLGMRVFLSAMRFGSCEPWRPIRAPPQREKRTTLRVSTLAELEARTRALLSVLLALLAT